MHNIFNQFKSYTEQFLLELLNTYGKIKNSKEEFHEITAIENCIKFIENLSLDNLTISDNILKTFKETHYFCSQAVKSALEISYKSDTPKFLENEIFLLEALISRIEKLISENENKIELEKQYKDFIENRFTNNGEEEFPQSKSDFFNKVSADIETLQKKINRAHNNTITIRKIIEENKITAINSTTEIEKQFEKLKDLYDYSSEFIEKSNNKIYELLTIASNSVINGSYRENALRELRSADRLRWLAITIMLSIISFTLFSFYDLQNNNIDKSTFVLRMVSGLLFSIPAIYLTRESSKHRNNHLFYLQKSLDLAAFEPFISGVDEDKKKLLKAEMAEKIFFKNQIKESKESYPVDINEILRELFSRIEIKNK